jgi:hypothetical protein
MRKESNFRPRKKGASKRVFPRDRCRNALAYGYVSGGKVAGLMACLVGARARSLPRVRAFRRRSQ